MKPDPLPDPPRGAGVPAAAAYLLGFVTGLALLLTSRRPFVRFHAWQSILFSGGLLAVALALDRVPIVGIGIVLMLATTGLAVWLLLVVQAWRGRWFLLPLLGDVALERVSFPAESASSGGASP